jgi:hypothetical protein
LAEDMLKLADKYKKPIDELHHLFFMVSCDRKKLIQVLEGKVDIKQWSPLEDLALLDHFES